MKWLLVILLAGILIIRGWGVQSLPNGFAWDEIDNGYQAYSLFQTGKDMFGNTMPVLVHSLADYKSSGYIYLTVPFVKYLGITPLSTRLPAVLLGALSVITLGLIVARYTNHKWGLVAAIIMAISPWWWHYSRLSFEAVGMMTFFLIGLALLPRKLFTAMLFMALSVWTYSTAKLFVPLFLVILGAVYGKFLSPRKLLTAGILFTILILPVQWQSFFGKGGTRFKEISIFTDPTTSSQINYALESSQISSGISKQVGLSPRLIDRLSHNKITFWTNRLITNYLTAFSTDFLFLKGDPNLRHSPGQNSTGQLHLIEFITLCLGSYWLATTNVLSRKIKVVLLLWLIIAPLASIVTRDGGGHATRLLFMLPVLTFISSAGIILASRNKLLMLPIVAGFAYCVFQFTYFYYNDYRGESARPFQFGTTEAILEVLKNEYRSRIVIIDLKKESALMSYLAATNFPPAKLQSMHPISQFEILPGVAGIRFENIIILPPGERAWSDLERQNSINIPLVLVTSAESKPVGKLINTIKYPDNTDAFYIQEY